MKFSVVLFISFVFFGQQLLAQEPQLSLVDQYTFGPNDNWQEGIYFPNKALVLADGSAFFRGSNRVWKFDDTKKEVLPGALFGGQTYADISASSVVEIKNGLYVVGNIDGKVFWLNNQGQVITSFDTQHYLISIGDKNANDEYASRITSNPLVTSEGKVVVASNCALWFFDQAGHLLNHYLIPNAENDNSRFEASPIELQDKQIYIGNSVDGKAYYFSPSGALNTVIDTCAVSGHQGTCGTRATALQLANGLIVQGGNGYLSFLTADGKLSKSYELDAEFLSAPFVLPNSDVVILDEGGGPHDAFLYYFSQDGTLKSHVAVAITPNAIQVMGRFILIGEMEVADSTQGHIEVIDTATGTSSTIPTFGEVMGMTVWKDQIYVLEADQQQRTPSKLMIFSLR